MKTVVINNKEALISCQLPHNGKDSSGMPQLSEAVTFIPGANLVDSKILKTLRLNDKFELFFKTKIPPSKSPEQNPEKVGKEHLVVVKCGKDGELDDAEPFKNMPRDQYLPILKEILVTSILNDWLRYEQRPEVRHEIQSHKDYLSGKALGGPAAFEQ